MFRSFEAYFSFESLVQFVATYLITVLHQIKEEGVQSGGDLHQQELQISNSKQVWTLCCLLALYNPVVFHIACMGGI